MKIRSSFEVWTYFYLGILRQEMENEHAFNLVVFVRRKGWGGGKDKREGSEKGKGKGKRQ